MCTYMYSQLKINKCVTPRGQYTPLMFQNCTRLAEKIFKNLLKVEA